jgi:hypothetical protein
VAAAVRSHRLAGQTTPVDTVQQAFRQPLGVQRSAACRPEHDQFLVRRIREALRFVLRPAAGRVAKAIRIPAIASRFIFQDARRQALTALSLHLVDVCSAGIQDPAMKTDQTVAEIDRARESYFTRSTDRPQGRIRPRSRQSDEVKVAKSRLRTAAWRNELDKRGRPESDAVALQLLVCLIHVARDSGYEVADMPETKKAFDRMFSIMEERGFQLAEVKAVIKRLTRRAGDRDVGHDPVISE